MTVRAKCYVTSVELLGWGTIIKLRPVTKTSEENEKFFTATPTGLVEMTIKNEVAAAQFAPGQEYYIDFIPAD